MEEFSGIRELGREFVAHFRSNLVAAVVDPGTDGRLQVARQCAELAAHFAHPLFDDTSQCPAPTGVKHADSTAFRVNEDDGQTVGGLNGEQQIGRGGDQAIAHKGRVGRRYDEVDQIGVDLAKRNQGPEPALVVSAQFFQERCAVALDSTF